MVLELPKNQTDHDVYTLRKRSLTCLKIEKKNAYLIPLYLPSIILVHSAI